MAEFYLKAQSQGNISFVAENFQTHFEEAEAIFICVNTPPIVDDQEDLEHEKKMGQSTDMRAFKSVVKSIGEAYLKSHEHHSHKILINKSTVPIGTS